ncbi:MAG: MBOAT family protein [Muribaculaceae bacterium]|nr:MBOAT family protein [Muribaculaceae bacterium]
MESTISLWLESLNIDLDKVVDVLSYDPSRPLLFNTGLFLLLFAAFAVVYRALRPLRTARMIFTILFSLYFYYMSSGLCCLILAGVAVSDWALGRWMGSVSRDSIRRLIVAINITVNVGMLVYFKYFNLLADTLSRFLTEHIDPLEIILPAGISFFTFRSISYIVDLYRGTLQPCRSLLDYMFFLTFFPPLLAGPVVRAKDMLPQIASDPVATPQMVGEGVWLIMLGIIKKMVIADYIAGNFVDRVFDNPALYSGFENMMATFGFTIQLYCDFSGYSDMAIGIALLLGFKFKENFNAPFKAQNPTEFWHRWHISLSTWLRDYVYILMGGNRCSRPRAYFNQFATMVIGGFWHGASWMYVIWGAVHGALLVIHKMIRGILPATGSAVVAQGTGDAEVSLWAPEPQRVPLWLKAINMVVTFLLVAAAFMLFRARSMEDVGMMWHQILTDFHLSVAPQFVSGYLMIVLAMVAGYMVHVTPSRFTSPVKQSFISAPLLIQTLALAAVLLIAIQVRSSDIVPFIYLQY